MGLASATPPDKHGSGAGFGGRLAQETWHPSPPSTIHESVYSVACVFLICPSFPLNSRGHSWGPGHHHCSPRSLCQPPSHLPDPFGPNNKTLSISCFKAPSPLKTDQTASHLYSICLYPYMRHGHHAKPATGAWTPELWSPAPVQQRGWITPWVSPDECCVEEARCKRAGTPLT